MTHLTMEQLVAIREPGLEPGVQSWRDHIAACPACQVELERLDQRVARLKALPTLRPSRDRFAAVRRQARAERRRRTWRVVMGGVALAASLTLAVVVFRHRPERQLVSATDTPELQEAMARSQQLERALASFDPDRQVVDGRAASITASLEDRLARVDQQIQVVDLMDATNRDREALRLWRERVGLLDALMDVHLTGARYVGF
jgi:hypothetical protein